ncbi:MAG: PhoH family protein [Calditrichia bacterium]
MKKSKQTESIFENQDDFQDFSIQAPEKLHDVLENIGQKRVFILDTNVLLHDPTALFRFEEHIVLIPLITLEEVDQKKNDQLIGYNAREVSHKLESMLIKSSYNNEGVLIPNGKNGLLFFVSGVESPNFPKELSRTYVDNIFLAQVMALKEKYPNVNFTIVTKDRNFRIKAISLGLEAEDYKHDKITEESLIEIFKPLQELVLSDDEVNQLFTKTEEGYYWIPYSRKYNLKYNEGVILKDLQGKEFGIALRKEDILKYYRYEKIKVLDTTPKVLELAKFSRNYEQAVAIAQGLDDSITVQTIVGRAGTGKTYLAMAIALEKVFKENKYHSIKMIKPVVSKSRLGEELGFLPGSLKKKLSPHMRPFLEKLREFLDEDFLDDDRGLNRLMDQGVIEMLNMADVRGTDFSNSIILFDEAQNANPFQMRTVGTRISENCKLIVLGDPSQIDNIYLDKYSNALVNLYVNAQRHQAPFLATVSLNQMVRSETSKWFEENIFAPQERNKKN